MSAPEREPSRMRMLLASLVGGVGLVLAGALALVVVVAWIGCARMQDEGPPPIAPPADPPTDRR